MYKPGLRRLARVEQVQQQATLNSVLGGIADRNLGDDVLEDFATTNASNVYAKAFLHWREHGNAITILQLYIHGVQAAMIMTETCVDRDDHDSSSGNGVASFQAVVAMTVIYPTHA